MTEWFKINKCLRCPECGTVMKHAGAYPSVTEYKCKECDIGTKIRH